MGALRGCLRRSNPAGTAEKRGKGVKGKKRLGVRFAPDSSDRLRQALRAVSERSDERVLTKSPFGGTINFSKAVA